jgi:glycosyltransferase involved in cell wall biosynthesis
MKRQTIQPYEWIVVDDFQTPTKCTMGQKVIRRTPYWRPKENTLQLNLLEGLKAITGDIVLIIEDDDWYHPNYIENMMKKFQKYFDEFENCASESLALNKPSLIVAEAFSKYYNIKNYSYMIHPNITHGSLFQTGFTADLIPQILSYLNMYQRERFFDRILWRTIKSCHKIMFMTKYSWSVGIKNLPGRSGLGCGHNHKMRYVDESSFETLTNWIGKNDTIFYQKIEYNFPINQVSEILNNEKIKIECIKTWIEERENEIIFYARFDPRYRKSSLAVFYSLKGGIFDNKIHICKMYYTNIEGIFKTNKVIKPDIGTKINYDIRAL